MDKRLKIVPQCKLLTEELRKYRYPDAPKVNKRAKHYDHALDPYLDELAKRMLLRL